MSFLTDKPVMVLWDFLSKRVSIPYSTDFCALGRVVDGELVGVVGFTNFTGSSCQVHFAGDNPHWATRELIETTFRYVFDHLKLKLMMVLIPSGNKHSLQINLRLGFKELAFIKDAHPDGGIHVLGIRRDECRWLRSKNHVEEKRARCA